MLLLLVGVAEKLLERVEPLVPEALVELEPARGIRERLRVEATEVRPALHRAAHEAGALEHFDVLRRGRQRDAEGLRELAHRSLSCRQIAKHLPPSRIGERLEHAIE